eukprot:6178720-Pyramimonas_sp.AAC.1
MDRSDAGSTGIFSRWTNQTQGARVYSHDGPIGAGTGEELRGQGQEERPLRHRRGLRLRRHHRRGRAEIRHPGEGPHHQPVDTIHCTAL